jgi:hypothetical protein
LFQPSGLLVSYMPVAVAVVGMTGADASEETGLFPIVAIQPGHPGRVCKAAVPSWPPPVEAIEPQTDGGDVPARGREKVKWLTHLGV